MLKPEGLVCSDCHSQAYILHDIDSAAHWEVCPTCQEEPYKGLMDRRMEENLIEEDL